MRRLCFLHPQSGFPPSIYSEYQLTSLVRAVVPEIDDPVSV